MSHVADNSSAEAVGTGDHKLHRKDVLSLLWVTDTEKSGKGEEPPNEERQAGER